jgi:RNA recognition motif-containing protein
LGNLGVEVDEAFLARVFSKFASFVPGSARVRRQPDGTTRCYGYVTFSERRDIDAAMAEFDGQLVGTGRVRLSSCLYNAEARRLSPAQLRERCEMRKRSFFFLRKTPSWRSLSEAGVAIPRPRRATREQFRRLKLGRRNIAWRSGSDSSSSWSMVMEYGTCLLCEEL